MLIALIKLIFANLKFSRIRQTGYHVTVIKFPYSNILTWFDLHFRVHDMDRDSKGVRLYGKQVREWSSPPPASPGIFYSSYEFPASENDGKFHI